jgi:glycosyltransferase involved in cell wall biosynthesis
MTARPIRVLHVVGTGRAGGVETFALLLATHLDSRQVQTEVLVLGESGPVTDRLRATGIPVHFLSAQASTPARIFKLARILVRGRFDLLHSSVGGGLTRNLARSLRIRTLTHIHGPMDAWAQEFEEGLARAKDIRHAYLSGADEVAACSHYMADAIAPFRNGRRPLVLSPGVDTQLPAATPQERARVRAGLEIASEDITVVFVGRLVPQKGVHHLLTVAELLADREPAIRFLVVGDGTLRTELEEEARRAGLGSVQFLGERHDVPHLLAAADLVVVPSEWEPFGIVNLEAMAAGRPVIAFATGGIPEIVLDGETGLLVPHRDSLALAKAILHLAGDPLTRRRLGEAGQRQVRARWDIRRTAAEVLQVYRRLVRRGAAESVDPD